MKNRVTGQNLVSSPAKVRLGRDVYRLLPSKRSAQSGEPEARSWEVLAEAGQRAGLLPGPPRTASVVLAGGLDESLHDRILEVRVH